MEIVLLAAACSETFSQQLPFHVYTAKDGLIRTDVRAMCQDPRGFLWLGTPDGLSRYDGAVFLTTIFPGGLTANFVNDITADSTGNVWVATNSGGINRLSGSQVTQFLPVPRDPAALENRANAILPLGAGVLLVGTDAGLLRFEDGHYTRLYAHEELLERGVGRLLRDRAGMLWIGTFAGLGVVTRGGSSEGLLWVLKGTAVNALVADGRGMVWVGTDNGLHEFGPAQTPGSLPVPLPLASPLRPLETLEVRSLLADSKGALWIGTESGGVSKFDASGQLHTYTSENGLPGNRVMSMIEDREHDLWFATNAGVAKLAGDHLTNFMLSGGLGRLGVTSITEDRAGRYWVGTQYGLARLAADGSATYSVASGLGSSYVLSLCTDRTGTVWVGTTDGLSKLRTAHGDVSFITYRFGKPGMPAIVRSLNEDGDGNLWVGAVGRVYLCRNGLLTGFPLGHSLKSHLALASVRDNARGLWVGTEGDGIFRFAVEGRKGWAPTLRLTRHVGLREGLTDESIRSGMKDALGNIWFGTRSGGVCRLTPAGDSIGRISSFTVENGLSGNWVRSILQDRSGNIWLGTNRGVDMLSFDSAGVVHVRSFTVRDGLAGDEVLSCFEDSKGAIWLGGSLGLTRYIPSDDLPDTVAPFVWLTRFQVFGADDTLAMRELRADLAADQHSVAFEFIGISFRDESKVRYRSMLEGLDASWGAVTDRRYASYTHLPPGRYVFKVAACNAGGIWSSLPATFAFSIATPFWQTWWFIALVALTVATVTYGAHRFRVRKILELEAVRSKIAADLHDDIGSTLSSISIFSEMAEQEAGAAAPRAARLMQRIGESSRAMLESLDDIVWAINPNNDRLEEMLMRMRAHATELFEASGIAFTIRFPEGLSGLRLSMDVRRQLYLVYKEALNNIVRHSGCHEATIALSRAGQELVLTISDDGKGFKGKPLAEGNGLRNMETRAASVGGSLTISSRPNGGTIVSLKLKIT